MKSKILNILLALLFLGILACEKSQEALNSNTTNQHSEITIL